MATLGTAVALLLVVATSAAVWGGEARPAATPTIAGAIEPRDVRQPTPAPLRVTPDRQRSIAQDRRERAMIIGLMMLMDARHRR